MGKALILLVINGKNKKVLLALSEDNKVFGKKKVLKIIERF